jgi:hypothetical protein
MLLGIKMIWLWKVFIEGLEIDSKGLALERHSGLREQSSNY